MSRSGSDGIRPEHFQIGSPESRAAARAVIESRERNVPRFQIVFNVARPRREGQPETTFGKWMPHPGGGFVRIIRCPPDTDEETIRRLLATP